MYVMMDIWSITKRYFSLLIDICSFVSSNPSISFCPHVNAKKSDEHNLGSGASSWEFWLRIGFQKGFQVPKGHADKNMYAHDICSEKYSSGKKFQKYLQ